MPDFLDYRFAINDDYKTGVLNRYTLREKNVKVPHIVAGFELNSVGRWAFSYNTDAFYYETQIESIEFEEGFKEIYHGAFFDCPKLKKLILPSTISKFYGDPFEGAPNIKEFVFPNGNDYFVFENGKLMSKDKKTTYYEVK